MRFLLDECVARTTALLLRELGHDVVDIKELRLFGLEDREVYQLACRQNRILFATDKGFRRFNPAACGGLIISTVIPNTPPRYEPRLEHLLASTRARYLAKRLIFLEEKRHHFARS